MMLTRRTLLSSSLGAGLSLAARPLLAAPKSAEPLYWDDHAGWGYAGPQDIDFLDQWRSAGVKYLSINVGYDVVPWQTTIRAIADYNQRIEARPDVVLCSTLAQVKKAWAAGKLAVTYDIEGMGALNGDLSMVEFYYRQGVRQMLIAYNLNNDAGGGCHDEDHGLTDFGRAVVGEMNRVGMVVDCAHSGIKSGLEAMKLSTKPCIFSHANARALQDHERNITDEQIKALAATGGVIGVTGVGRYLTSGTPSAETMVAHIDYIAKLIGIEHVGISFDYDPGGGPDVDPAVAAKYWPARQYPASLKMEILSPSLFPEIGRLLRAKGYKEEAVRGVLGGNFMRIASQVWAG
jgi:membrane dipeptidase